MRNFTSSRATIGTLLFIVTGALCSAAERPPDPMPLSERVLYLHYNASGAPPMVSREQVLAAGERAAKGWLPCGIRFVMSTDTDAKPGVRDGQNVVGWMQTDVRPQADSGDDVWGVVVPWTRDHKTIEFDIVFNRGTIRTGQEMSGVFAHALGRVLGLAESDDETSVMRRRAPRAEIDSRPSHADIRACQQLYR